MAKWGILIGILGVPLVAATFFSAAPQQPADFSFINRGSITTLDPAGMSWMQDIRLALTIWEGLYTYHPQTTDPIPGCAFAPEISEDKRTYTFRIRLEARWNNGDPVTAGDFVYAWRRAIEPGTAADYAFFFDRIEGVKEYFGWRTREIERIGQVGDPGEKRKARDAHLAEADRRFKTDVGIVALDEKTLRVRLVRPVPYFLDLCAFSVFLPVHAVSLDKYRIVSDTGLIYYDEQWVKPENALYNGPFYMTSWQFKRTIRLAKNPHYWGRDTVKLNSVEIIDAEDNNTAWLLYSSGRVDWISELTTVYTPKLIEASGSPLANALNKTGTERHDIHAFPAFGTYFYNFNCKDRLPDGRANPFRDHRVRQAFTMAVNRQSLVDQVLRQGNPPTSTLIPAGSIPGYPPVTGLPDDPARARALLAEAGYPEGRGFPEVVILFNTEFRHGDIAQAVAAMWERELGVRARTTGKEIKTFAQDKKKVNFMICRASWYGDYGDPTTFLDMFMTGNGNNDSGYSDATYDRMLREADVELDPQTRMQKLAAAENYLMTEGLPLVSLYTYVNVFAFNPDRVKNLYLTPRMMTMLHAVEVVR
jgi:oligopeptide transport system substrate-binding protein